MKIARVAGNSRSSFHFTRSLVCSLVLAASLIAGSALAQSNQTGSNQSGSKQSQSEQALAKRTWGVGQPKSADDLPPGQLRRKLLELPAPARGKALKWLQDISFTGTDLEVLRIDDGGNVYFVDPVPAGQDNAAAESAPGTEAAPSTTLADAFLLHSRPGAPNVVFIDFDGHSFTNTAWSSGTLSGVPYDLDGNPGNFNDTERTRIVDIWHRVAEDLAPFNIDVTTEQPASFNSTTGRILVTRDVDATGADMPAKDAGGVAYVGVFGYSNYHTYYSPALVYYNNLGGGFEGYVAEASSHEFGHNLGLSHDGTTGGTTYYAGHGSGLVSWAPIMGNSYYNNVTQWSKGEYAGANQTQDDLVIIEGKLGLKGDDHGNSIAAGSLLDIGPGGSVVSSNPELDPHNLLPENKGVIDSAGDVDVFSFTAGAGPLALTVTPAWDAFYRASDRRGANLDLLIELRDAGGAVLASNDPVTNTNASISTTVSGGTYHLLVSGVGNGSNYSDYDSLGQYFINGSVTTGSDDVTAPSPDPMSFSSLPTANGESSISMTASLASDESGGIQYRFTCVSGGLGCVTSAWQSSRNYTATGLLAATQYTYTVAARDLFGNITGQSATASATTDEPPPPPPFVDHVASSSTLVAGTVSGAVGNTHTNDGLSQNITEVLSGGKPSSRYNYLEYRWQFQISQGASATLVANAWSSGSTDGDTFNFQYSLNGGSSWTLAFNVASTSNANLQSLVLPGAPSGTVWVRVIDSNRSTGAQGLNTVFVDHLYIQVANPPTEPPDGGAVGLNATAVSASQINLAWTDGASNEAGYRIERSPNGSTGWAQVADLPNGSQAWSNTGLAASTPYWYRVQAWNANGVSAWANANATTLVAPPPPAIVLAASGYKQKGYMYVNLSWTGATSVDVYRNGNVIATGVSGSSYLDNTGIKGSGTLTHRVCAAGSTTNCSNVTSTVL